jgi:hypothetical protein
MMLGTTNEKFLMHRILEISVHYGPKLKISGKFKISIFTKLSYFKFEVYMISLSMGLELSRTTEMSLGSGDFGTLMDLPIFEH